MPPCKAHCLNVFKDGSVWSLDALETDLLLAVLFNHPTHTLYISDVSIVGISRIQILGYNTTHSCTWITHPRKQRSLEGLSLGNEHFIALKKVTSNPNRSTPRLLHECRAYVIVFRIAYVDKSRVRLEFPGSDMSETT